MGDARVVFLLEKIGETFGLSPDELRGDMDGLGDKVRPFFEPEGPPKLIFVYQAPDTVDLKTGAVTRQAPGAHRRRRRVRGWPGGVLHQEQPKGHHREV